MNIAKDAVSKFTGYNLDPKQIVVEDNYNVRTDFGDMDNLKKSIKENGVRRPITVKMVKGVPTLREGHRRMKAVMELIEEGHKIESVPVINVTDILKTNVDDIADLIISNDGKELSMLEQGYVFHRLEEEGLRKRQIAKKVGRTESHISSCLMLTTVPQEVQDMIRQDVISSSLVLELNRKAEGNDEVLMKEIESAKAKMNEEGEQKITRKMVSSPAAAPAPAPEKNEESSPVSSEPAASKSPEKESVNKEKNNSEPAAAATPPQASPKPASSSTQPQTPTKRAISLSKQTIELVLEHLSDCDITEEERNLIESVLYKLKG